MKTLPDVASLARLLEEASEAIMLASPGGKVLAANRAARALWVDQASVAGRRVDELLQFPGPPSDSPADAVLLTSAGGRRAIHASRSTLETAGGASVMVVLRPGRSPESADREITSLIGLLTHDLRSPLANIIGFARLVVQRLPTLSLEDIGDFADRIKTNAERLDRLITDLANLRSERRREPVYESIPAASLIEDALRPQAERIEKAKATVTVDAGTGRLWTDRIKLQLILEHLIDNALTYGRRDAPPTVAVACSGGKPGSACITVDDNGPGLGPGEENEIFLLFRRGSASRGTKGTGIGLALAAELAASMGGSIETAPSPLGGASFKVILPGR
jgi:two-component system sensor histidine kinase KdpD